MALELLPDLLDKLEEVIRGHLLLAAEQDVRVELVVALVELVEVHRVSFACVEPGF
jgi:hypothetical protein